MIPIQINISAIADEFNLTETEIKSFATYVVEQVASTFAHEWYEVAKTSLHQSRGEYLKGIYVEDIDEKTKVVGLKGIVPNMVESGATAFDMKEGFEKSNKRVVKLALDKDGKIKRDKNGNASSGGWYLTIPFRFATPDAVGESSVFSSKLPEEIHTILKTRANLGEMGGLKFDEIPKEFQLLKTRPEIKLENKTFDEYKHKNPIYEGIVKSPMQFHSQYSSFRRVSDLSDPNSWIHSGIEAHGLAEKALDSMDISNIVDKSIDQFLISI